jgi:AmmeMemoRadiSam system protein B
MERHAVVAGSFYPGSAGEITKMMEKFIGPGAQKRDCIAVVAPHAGYVYSGRVAGATYSRVNIPRSVIILCPTHTGLGARVSLYPGKAWHTPLGRVPVDGELNSLLLQGSALIEEDELAHVAGSRPEHSAEVQVPFLQYLQPDLRISVIVVATHDFEELAKVGSAVAGAVRAAGEKVLIVASSDMTHFKSQEVAKEQDELAISKIEAMDPRGLLETVTSRGISMCGVAPVTAALAAALELGAESAKLTMYETSGDVTGDLRSVVGYAGLIIE